MSQIFEGLFLIHLLKKWEEGAMVAKEQNNKTTWDTLIIFRNK